MPAGSHVKLSGTSEEYQKRFRLVRELGRLHGKCGAEGGGVAIGVGHGGRQVLSAICGQVEGRVEGAPGPGREGADEYGAFVLHVREEVNGSRRHRASCQRVQCRNGGGRYALLSAVGNQNAFSPALGNQVLTQCVAYGRGAGYSHAVAAVAAEVVLLAGRVAADNVACGARTQQHAVRRVAEGCA